MTNLLLKGALLCTAIAAFAVTPALAQDETGLKIDADAVAESGKKAEDFVPSGWRLEAKVSGDLNQDGIADHALTLIDASFDAKAEENRGEGNRALVVVFGEKGGKLRRAAVADSLLQCASCGGAFYGIVAAPANVAIEKGVLKIDQDHGSRWVSEMTYRFRFDEQPSMFILIGYDYSSRDRAEASTVTESTNYLTGQRITTTYKKGKPVIKKTRVERSRIDMQSIVDDDFEGEALKRLGLD